MMGPLVPKAPRTGKSIVTISPFKGKAERTESVASSQKEGTKSGKVGLCPIFEGLATEGKKRKRQDVMVQVRGGSTLPHTPLSSIFCTLTCYSFELCALSGLSPHVQHDQFRPCRIFLFHFCPRNKKNFHFQQRNKMDFQFSRASVGNPEMILILALGAYVIFISKREETNLTFTFDSSLTHAANHPILYIWLVGRPT